MVNSRESPTVISYISFIQNILSTLFSVVLAYTALFILYWNSLKREQSKKPLVELKFSVTDTLSDFGLNKDFILEVIFTCINCGFFRYYLSKMLKENRGYFIFAWLVYLAVSWILNLSMLYEVIQGNVNVNIILYICVARFDAYFITDLVNKFDIKCKKHNRAKRFLENSFV